MDEKLKEIEARCEKATPGPMDYSGYCMIDGAIHVGTIGPKGKTGINFTDETSCDRLVLDVSCRGEDDKQAISDADFYAHAQVDTRYLLTALRESAERERSQQQASEINHEEYQDLCGQFALPKACGCNKNGNDRWCALAPFHEIKRLREREKKLVEALSGARGTLTDSRIGTHWYMEGSQIYQDFSDTVKEIDALLALYPVEPPTAEKEE